MVQIADRTTDSVVLVIDVAVVVAGFFKKYNSPRNDDVKCPSDIIHDIKMAQKYLSRRTSHYFGDGRHLSQF